MFAVETLEPELLQKLRGFNNRLNWFLNYRPDLARLVSRWAEPGRGQRHLLSLLRGHRMKCLLRRMLDETEFLSGYGVRALSRHHLDHPYVFGDCSKFQSDPHFRDYVPFHEFFHGDTGRGLGASHQTGWTGLVAKLLQPRRASR